MMLHPKGVQIFASEVVKRSYDDYVFDGKCMVALKDPFRSEKTFDQYNKLFNLIVRRVRHEDKIRQRDYSTEKADDFYNYLLGRLEELYYVKAQQLIDNSMFMRGDRFILFADGIDGKWLEGKAKKEIEEWANVKPSTVRGHRKYRKEKKPNAK